MECEHLLQNAIKQLTLNLKDSRLVLAVKPLDPTVTDSSLGEGGPTSVSVLCIVNVHAQNNVSTCSGHVVGLYVVTVYVHVSPRRESGKAL